MQPQCAVSELTRLWPLVDTGRLVIIRRKLEQPSHRKFWESILLGKYTTFLKQRKYLSNFPLECQMVSFYNRIGGEVVLLHGRHLLFSSFNHFFPVKDTILILGTSF